MRTILIADDHPMVRQGLKQFLVEGIRDIHIIEASHGDEVLDRIAGSRIDALIMDISMPGKNGLEVLAEIRKTNPALPVLILTMHPEDQLAVRAFKLGATGYLVKSSAPEELVSAVNKILDGKKAITPSCAEHLASAVRDSGEKPHERLSAREQQVFLRIASGLMPKQIASELGVSIKTVNTLRERILEKMDLASNADLVRYAMRERLVE